MLWFYVNSKKGEPVKSITYQIFFLQLCCGVSGRLLLLGSCLVGCGGVGLSLRIGSNLHLDQKRDEK